MLPLQLSKPGLHKKIPFIIKLLILSFVVHSILALAFFFLSLRRYRLVINNIDLENADIILMPFTKHINKRSKRVPQAITQKPKKATTIQRKTEKKTSQTSLIKKTPSPKPPPKPKQEQTAKKEDTLKKKPEPQKKIEPQKNNKVKKSIPRSTTTKVAKQAVKKVESVSKKNKQNSTAVGRHDLDLLEQAQVVKQAIHRSWSRPTGLSKNCEYHAVIRINARGNAELLKETPSGAMALDMSARNFIMQFSFPKQLAQYEIEIVL